MKNLLILLTLIIVLFSCKQKKESDNIIDLTLITEPNVTNLSELGSEITYIPLETNEDCFIERINKLIYANESFFMTSGRMLNLALYRFKKNGEFSCKIGQRGKAPSEYIDIMDFIFDEESGTIDILTRNEIKKFTVNGKWEKSFKYNDNESGNVSRIAKMDNQYLVYLLNLTGDTNNSYLLLDETGKPVKKFKNKYKFKVNGASVAFPEEGIFYNFNNTLFTKELHSDTIFEFYNGEFTPKYIFEQGDAKFTTELRSNAGPDFPEELKKRIYCTNVFESIKYLFVGYQLNGNYNYLLKDKFEGTQYLINNKTGLKNDFDNGPNFKIQNTTTIDGTEYMISWIDAFELKAHIDSDEFKNSTPKFPEKKKQLEQLANSLDENDNPVLMLVKLK